MAQNNRYSVEKKMQSNQIMPITPEPDYLTNDSNSETYVNSSFRPHKDESVGVMSCHVMSYSNINK
jgi:hypothetical protein